MILEHHENHLGGGYPDNLKYTGLNPLTKILRITNEYCGLTLKQKVNTIYDHEKAIGIMKARDKSYDPDIFNKFLTIFNC